MAFEQSPQLPRFKTKLSFKPKRPLAYSLWQMRKLSLSVSEFGLEFHINISEVVKLSGILHT